MVTRIDTMLLSAGGLGSLVALAMAKAAQDRAGGRRSMPGVVFVHDGRDSARQRLEHTRQQADFYGVPEVFELSMTHLHGAVGGLGPRRGADGETHEPTAPASLLLAGVQMANRAGARSLTWAVTRGGDPAGLARAAEQATLASHLNEASRGDAVDAEPDQGIEICTPFLELTGPQLLELGERVGASWGLAWSCLLGHAKPCGSCAGCRQRRRAFEAAGLSDPMDPGSIGRSVRRAGTAA